MSPKVVLLDYGSGNIRSAFRALERAGAEVNLTADRAAAMDADGLVVPGVGAFRACVEGIRAVRGHEVIGRRLAGGRPVLGAGRVDVVDRAGGDAVDRVLAEPAHKVVQLRTPGGANGGSISWSRHDWVVITNVLSRPPEGTTYACWLIDDDSAQMIGTMEFAGDTAFWAASVDKWATWEITPTTRFVVTLHTDGPTPRTSPPVLEAALGA